MILDNTTMFADELAYGGTSTVVDLGVTRPGPGNPIKVFASGSADLAGATGLTVLDGTTATASSALMSLTATLASKTIEFELPSDVSRYVRVNIVGATAGSWSAGVILPGAQSNI